MVTRIFKMPNFLLIDNNADRTVNILFFQKIIDTLNELNPDNGENTFHVVSMLFSSKITNPEINFDYGYTPKGINIYYGDVLILSADCDTEFMYKDMTD